MQQKRDEKVDARLAKIQKTVEQATGDPDNEKDSGSIGRQIDSLAVELRGMLSARLAHEVARDKIDDDRWNENRVDIAALKQGQQEARQRIEPLERTVKTLEKVSTRVAKHTEIIAESSEDVLQARVLLDSPEFGDAIGAIARDKETRRQLKDLTFAVWRKRKVIREAITWLLGLSTLGTVVWNRQHPLPRVQVNIPVSTPTNSLPVQQQPGLPVLPTQPIKPYLPGTEQNPVTGSK